MTDITYTRKLSFLTALQAALATSPLVTVIGVSERTLKKRLSRNGYNLRVATDYQRGAAIVQRRRE